MTQTAQAPEKHVGRRANGTYANPDEYGCISQVADPTTAAAAVPKVGHKDTCPCGSGKKYKNCRSRLS